MAGGIHDNLTDESARSTDSSWNYLQRVSDFGVSRLLASLRRASRRFWTSIHSIDGIFVSNNPDIPCRWDGGVGV